MIDGEMDEIVEIPDEIVDDIDDDRLGLDKKENSITAKAMVE